MESWVKSPLNSSTGCSVILDLQQNDQNIEWIFMYGLQVGFFSGLLVCSANMKGSQLCHHDVDPCFWPSLNRHRLHRCVFAACSDHASIQFVGQRLIRGFLVVSAEDCLQ